MQMIGLDDKIEPLLEDDVTPQVLEMMPTYRKLAKIVLSRAMAKGGDESLDIVSIGLKLRNPGEVALDDSEFRLLKKKVQDNEAGLTGIMQGSLLKKLKLIEDSATQAEKKA